MKSPYMQLIDSVSTLRYIPSKKIAKRLVDSIFEAVADGAFGIIMNRRPLHIPRFGVFAMRTRKSRKVLNPITKEPMVLPAEESLRFFPSKYLKRKV